MCLPSAEEDLSVFSTVLADKNKEICIYLVLFAVIKISLCYIITIRLYLRDTNPSLFREEKKEVNP